MPFNINEFHSEMAKRGGPAKQSNFDVLITEPPGIKFASFVNPERGVPENVFTLHVDSATVPGRGSEPINYGIYGPDNFVAGKAVYPPINIELICSPDQRERRLFLSWQDLAVGNARNLENFDGASSRIEDQFEMGYAKDPARGYLSECVTIRLYNDFSDKPTFQTKLIDVYPSNVDATAVSWGSGEVMKLSVRLMYRYFIETGNQLQPALAGQRRPANPFLTSGLGAAVSTGVGAVAGRVGAKRTAAIMTAGQVIRGRI